MRLRLALLACALALAFVVAGCGDDSAVSTTPTTAVTTTTTAVTTTTEATTTTGMAITVADFVGTWSATSHVFTDNADTTQQFDTIANGGETRMTVLDGGRARTWITIGDFSDEFDAQLTVVGDTLVSTPAEASRPQRRWTFSLDGDTLTLTDPNSAFDFSGAGGPGVPATETIVLVLQ